MNNKTKKQDCNDGNRKSDFRTVTDYCFCLTREKVSGKGEDSFFFDIDREKGIIGVFDGSGGSGAKVYPFLKDTVEPMWLPECLPKCPADGFLPFRTI
nr:hypothetical protein [uncultured Blautia sp.]